jgi:hypothetical protein
VQRGLALLLAGAIAAGCGSDDGSDDGGETARMETVPVAGDVVRLESNRIPFTFEYPDDLTAERKPPRGTLARVSVKPGARLNALQVSRTAPRELGPERYLDEFKRDLEGSAESVATREERIGDLDTGVLEVEDSDFTSTSYFFTGAGRTWQVECIADPAHAQQIEAACRIALESIDFRQID